jgi:hypothetical protein
MCIPQSFKKQRLDIIYQYKEAFSKTSTLLRIKIAKLKRKNYLNLFILAPR